MTAQKAFEFANKLNHYLTNDFAAVINEELVRELGIERYKQFCKKMNTTPLRKNVSKPFYFKEEVCNNPVKTEDIILDKDINRQWGAATFLNVVKEFI